MDGRRGIVAITAALAAMLVFAASAAAIPNRLYPQGKSDFVFGPAAQTFGGNPSGSKPESKLFFTPDRRWWAVLATSGSDGAPPGLNLYELVDHNWQFRVHLPDTDPWEKADVLYDRRGLVVAVRDEGDAATRQSRVFRMRYGGGAWTAPGAPAPLTSDATESVTIARDSKGRLWAAWASAGAVKVAYTRSARSTGFRQTSIGAPGIDPDDVVAVTSFGSRRKGRIGVMWSDQRTHRFRFASRRDRDRVRRRSWRRQTAYGGGVGGCPTATSARCGDDHVNLKAVGGQVYAAVKRSLNDSPNGQPVNPADPLIVMLRRSTRGRWSAFTVSRVSENASRPSLLLAPGWGGIWVFAQRDFDDVFVWGSNSFKSPAFDPTGERPWTIGPGVRNDPTTTKQPIPARLTPVALTSLERGAAPTYDYWHNEFLP